MAAEQAQRAAMAAHKERQMRQRAEAELDLSLGFKEEGQAIDDDATGEHLHRLVVLVGARA